MNFEICGFVTWEQDLGAARTAVVTCIAPATGGQAGATPANTSQQVIDTDDGKKVHRQMTLSVCTYVRCDIQLFERINFLWPLVKDF